MPSGSTSAAVGKKPRPSSCHEQMFGYNNSGATNMVINPALCTRKVSDFLEAKWMKRIPPLLEQTLSKEKVEATVLVAGGAFYVSLCQPNCHGM